MQRTQLHPLQPDRKERIMAAFSFGGAKNTEVSLYDSWRKQKSGGGQTADSAPGYQNYGANQPTQGSNTGAWYTRAQQRSQRTWADQQRDNRRAWDAWRQNERNFVRDLAPAIGGWFRGNYEKAHQQQNYMSGSDNSLLAHNQQQQYQMYGQGASASPYGQTPRYTTPLNPPHSTRALELNANTRGQQPGDPDLPPPAWTQGTHAWQTGYTAPGTRLGNPAYMNQQQLREYMGGGPTQYGGLDPVEMRWQAQSLYKDRARTWGVGGYVPPRTNTSGGYGGYGYSDWGGYGGGGYGGNDSGRWYENMVQWSINKPNPG